MLDRNALWQLTRVRVMGFMREPEAMFWVFAFPVLLALALGIAFRNQSPQPVAVGVVAGASRGATPARATWLLAALGRSPDVRVVPLADAGAAALAMRRGRVSVLVAPGAAGDSAAALSYDPSRPESRLARLVVEDAIERAAGRRDPVRLARQTRIERGARYIDFLIPGLIGMNLLGTGMWGVGFPIATARQQKLLKRMLATPMRRRDYLLSFVFARLVWLVLEVTVIALFARWAFDVRVTGSWPAFAIVALIGAFAFSSLGLLVASRARTIEAVSGLMNFVMLPMWLLSGTFFSSARFPAWLQPFVKALPLTAVNDALRAIYNESASLATVRNALLLLAAWTIVCFALALRIFRWE